MQSMAGFYEVHTFGGRHIWEGFAASAGDAKDKAISHKVLTFNAQGFTPEMVKAHNIV